MTFRTGESSGHDSVLVEPSLEPIEPSKHFAGFILARDLQIRCKRNPCVAVAAQYSATFRRLLVETRVQCPRNE
jgi:hypothetical protein